MLLKIPALDNLQDWIKDLVIWLKFNSKYFQYIPAGAFLCSYINTLYNQLSEIVSWENSTGK